MPWARPQRPLAAWQAANWVTANELGKELGKTHMIPKDRKRLAEANSPIAEASKRFAEVKGLGAATGTILLTPNERRVAEDRRDCYWLYVVTDCDSAPRLQEPIRDPARLDWNEVTKVAHYYLSVDAMTQPMQVREDSPPSGGNRP